MLANKSNKLLESKFNSAQTNVLIMYSNGEGVPENDAEAVKWYRKAANQGYAPAQNNIGSKYFNGEGMPLDYTKALEWYRKAANQGQASSQSFLGNMYWNGPGTTQSKAMAYKWWNLAAAQGNETAKKNKEKFSKLMTQTEIREGQRRASEFKPVKN